MNRSNLEEDCRNIIDDFEKRNLSSTSSYRDAVERYADLEKRGLVQKRGSILLPIEDRYKLTFKYCRDDEDR